MGRIDLWSGTLAKLWARFRGYLSGAKNSSPCCGSVPAVSVLEFAGPVIAATTLAALRLIAESTELRDQLESNTRFFRAALTATGLTLRPGSIPSFRDAGDAPWRRNLLPDVGARSLRYRLFVSVVPMGPPAFARRLVLLTVILNWKPGRGICQVARELKIVL